MNASACTLCPENTFQAYEEQTGCKDCVDNTVAGVGSSECSADPTRMPTPAPSTVPSSMPTSPTNKPTSSPTAVPTGKPTSRPTSPTSSPTVYTPEPTMEPTSVRAALSSDLASVAENRYAYVSLIVSCILLCCCGAFFSYFFCYYRKKRAEAKELTPYEKWMMAKEAKELDGTILNFQNESTHNPFHVESSEASSLHADHEKHQRERRSVLRLSTNRAGSVTGARQSSTVGQRPSEMSRTPERKYGNKTHVTQIHLDEMVEFDNSGVHRHSTMNESEREMYGQSEHFAVRNPMASPNSDQEIRYEGDESYYDGDSMYEQDNYEGVNPMLHQPATDPVQDEFVEGQD